MVVAYVVPGISVASLYTALVAALILGLINALIKPLILLLTLPINILTLGLFTLVINACMFWLGATAVKGFTVVGFWPAFWGAFVLWLLNWVIAELLRKD